MDCKQTYNNNRKPSHNTHISCFIKFTLNKNAFYINCVIYSCNEKLCMLRVIHAHNKLKYIYLQIAFIL